MGTGQHSVWALALSLFLCWGTAQLDPLRLVGSRAADPLGAIVIVQARGLSWPKGTVRAGEETGLGVMFWRLMNLWRCLRGRSQWGSRGSRETQEEGVFSGQQFCVPDPAPLKPDHLPCSTDLALRAFLDLENQIPQRLQFSASGSVGNPRRRGAAAGWKIGVSWFPGN